MEKIKRKSKNRLSGKFTILHDERNIKIDNINYTQKKVGFCGFIDEFILKRWDTDSIALISICFYVSFFLEKRLNRFLE